MKDSDIEIIANRRQIDNKFPVLGFTVKTNNFPFYEVIVTTDKGLFAPERAAERKASNFFSSRYASNQLQRSDSADSVYIAPASVLNSFAQNSPKPSAIYYTLIAYTDESGNGAKLAHSPETLVNNAPSVELAPTFTGETLSKVLGINCDNLRRVESVSANYRNPDYFSALAENEPEDELEDGYSMMNSRDFSAVFESSSDENEIYAEDGYELNQQETQNARQEGQKAQSYDHDYSFSDYSDGAESEYLYGGENDGAGGDYEDGFEQELGSAGGGFSKMQESVFPAGANEPGALYDEESEPYGSDFDDWEDEYSAPQSAGREYESESFEYAGLPKSYPANGLNYQSNGHSSQTHYADDEFNYAQNDEDFEEYYGESFEKRGDQQLAGAAETGECSEEIAEKRRIKARKEIIEKIAEFESGGPKTRYKAINADQEFAAWKWHDAYQKYHIGLSYGIVQFTQDGGSLGKLLKMMRGRDKAMFDKIFGGEKLADELIKVTTASGAFSKDTKSGRSARVQPVGGTDIWLSPWKERFQAAGDHAPFQAAQNELANTEYLTPILWFCQLFGLDSERAVAMVYDRAVQMGVGGARAFISGAAGPLQTDVLRNQALTALGKNDIKQFQKDFGGLSADGKWGPMTHAAMVSALRALGTKSPIPIPTQDQMLDSIERAAAGKDWEHRVKTLRKSKDLSDTTFLF